MKTAESCQGKGKGEIALYECFKIIKLVMQTHKNKGLFEKGLKEMITHPRFEPVSPEWRAIDLTGLAMHTPAK